MMMAKLIEGSTTGSISIGSVHDIHTDVVEIPCTPVNVRKRKRRSYQESPDGPTGEVNAEIKKLLTYVPQVDEIFTIRNKIGEGTFSSVYLAEVKSCGPDVKQQFALKHIIPTSHPERILGELQCLHQIGGTENVMGMKLSYRERDHVVIVMPYFPHDSFHLFLRTMKIFEIREYMRNLFLALRRVHQFNVIHRDVKPSNFLCNHRLQKYALIDFGLAQRVPTSSRKSRIKGHPSTLFRLSPKVTQKTQRASQVASKQTLKENSKEVSKESMPRLTELDPNTFNRTLPQKAKGGPLVKTFQLPKTFNQRIAMPKKPVPTLTRPERQKPAGSARLTSGRGPAHKTCSCFGLLQVCEVCTSRSGQSAPRAGTPGFRSPEVLLKCPDQTTAVDMWAAGVIFLSILSGRYPFFKAQDDMTALAQIMSIVGTEEMKTAAREYGKEITCSVKLPAMDLKKMCIQLRKIHSDTFPPSGKRSKLSTPEVPPRNTRRRSLDNQRQTSPDGTPNASPTAAHGKRRSSRSPPSRVPKPIGKDLVPDSAYHLLQRLLDLNPSTRITAEEALRHQFIQEC
ncbi:cell division cycle 7-related protein kinase-like isoform X2 [Acanthaster planci]|nr:cell division cycle 7-related protein kinase-like isoform X2 [Acanthaster planci]XP_022085306.1 cell division cycle 7-related protein kinase-like isoform X2 [Acanthaster planci]